MPNLCTCPFSGCPSSPRAERFRDKYHRKTTHHQVFVLKTHTPGETVLLMSNEVRQMAVLDVLWIQIP